MSMHVPLQAGALVLLGVVLALVSARLAAQWDGNAQQSCPVANNTDYLFLGKAAQKGDRCGYLAGGAAPRCVNEELNLPLRDEDDRKESGDLVCLRNECVELLDAGEDCADTELEAHVVVGRPEACRSGHCRHLGGREWKCAEQPHHSGNGTRCVQHTDCEEGLRCAEETKMCVPRVAPNQPCTVLDPVDRPPTALPSDECTAGHYCSSFHDGFRCLPATFGHVGARCVWNTLHGRPACQRGKAYCDHMLTCRPLIKEGQPCMYLTNGSEVDNVAPCEYGLVCHPERPNPFSNIAYGKCAKMHARAAGQPALTSSVCLPGLFVDPALGICTDVMRTGQTCNTTADCISSDLEVGRVTCQCGKAHDLVAPGRCRKTPIAHPKLPHIRVDEACRKEYSALVIYLEQFYKKLGGAEDEELRKEYETEVDRLQHSVYCCMRRRISVTSHMYYLTGLFAIDLPKADVRCNTDLTWLWIVLGVLGAGIVLGICVVLSAALSSFDAQADGVAAVPSTPVPDGLDCLRATPAALSATN